MVSATDDWIARRNIRRFEMLLEEGGSADHQRQLKALLDEEQRRLNGGVLPGDSQEDDLD